VRETVLPVTVIKNVKKTAQRAFQLSGLDVKWRVPHPVHDLFELLKLYQVDTLVDFGVNSGSLPA